MLDMRMFMEMLKNSSERQHDEEVDEDGFEHFLNALRFGYEPIEPSPPEEPFYPEEAERGFDLYSYPKQRYQAYPDEKPRVNYATQDVGSLMDTIRKRESGGNYKAVNSLGYTGGYQAGAQWLEDAGLLKKGASKEGMRSLDNPDNWTIAGGKEAYMNNPQVQDMAMKKMLSKNQQQLTKMGLINSNTPQHEINGMLASAHLSGVGGTQKMMTGRANARDLYGTSARDYYNMGRNVR